MSLVTVNNKELDIDDSQPEDNSLAMVWLHGLMFCMASDKESGLFAWKKTTTAHRVVRFDALGHGQSQSSEQQDDYLWPKLGSDAVAVAEHTNAQKIVLAGASMGAATSLYAALELINNGQKDKLAGLVLVIPPTAWQTRGAQGRKYKLLALLNKLKLVPKFLPALVRNKVIPTFLNKTLPYTEAVLTRYMASHKPEVYQPLLNGAAHSDLPELAELAKIDVPCLILTWVEDDSHPVSTARLLRETLPNSEIDLANDARHVDLWDDKVNQFLKGIKGC